MVGVLVWVTAWTAWLLHSVSLCVGGCVCMSLCVHVCQAEGRRSVPQPDLASDMGRLCEPGALTVPRGGSGLSLWFPFPVLLPCVPSVILGAPGWIWVCPIPGTSSHLLIHTHVLCPRGHTPEAKDGFQYLSPSPTPYHLKKKPKDYIIKLKNVSSNKLSFLMVKSHF